MPIGVPWNPNKTVVLDALKRSDGVITFAAEALGVCRATLFTYVSKHPDVKEFVDSMRYSYDTKLLDGAENVLKKAIEGVDLDKALKSAFFVLNNKGSERGYSAKNNPNNPSGAIEGQLEQFRKDIASSKEVPGAGEPEKQEVEDGEPLLDQGQAGEQGQV